MLPSAAESLVLRLKRNFVLLWLRELFGGLAATLGAGAIIQGILTRYGLGEELIGIYVSFGSIVNFSASLLFSGVTSRTKKTIRYTALCFIAGGIIELGYAAITIWQMEQNTLFLLVMALSGVLAVITAIRTIFEYKLPCEVMDLDKYAVYCVGSGIIRGVEGILVGILLTYMFKTLDFVLMTKIVFYGTCAAMVIQGILNGLLKKIKDVPDISTKDGSESKHPTFDQLRILLKNRDFRILAIPGFLRGFGAALVALAAILAMRLVGLSDDECAMIATVSSAGGFICNLIYLPLIKIAKRPVAALAGSVLFLLMIPAFLCGNKTLFLVLFTLGYVGFDITGTSIPDLIYQHTPADIISPFHVWRLALLSVGTSVGTALYGFMMKYMPPVTVLLIGTLCFTAAGASHFFLYRRRVPLAEQEKQTEGEVTEGTQEPPAGDTPAEELSETNESNE